MKTFRCAALAAASLSVLAVRPARAWDATGHMLVTQIAQAHLTPAARARADALLQTLVNPARPAQRYDFVTASTWMDDIRDAEKMKGGAWIKALKPQHYVDINPDGSVPPLPNALGAVADAEAALRDPAASTQRQTRALAILLHVVGDLHQPLHAVGKLQGGNLFPIRGVPGLFKGLDAGFKPVPFRKTGGVYERLHAFWDSAYRYDIVERAGRLVPAQLYPGDDPLRPNLPRLQATAAALVAKYPPGAEQSVADPLEWARESSKIGFDWVFQTPRAAPPSPAYLHRAHEVACRRVVLAGYRLGALLNALLDPPAAPATPQ